MTVWKHIKRFRFWTVEKTTDDAGTSVVYKIIATPGSPWEPSNKSALRLSHAELEHFKYAVEQPVMCRCSDCDHYRSVKQWKSK